MQIDPRRVPPQVAVQRGGPWNTRMTSPFVADHVREGIGKQRVRVEIRGRQMMHERSVGAVLQQPAHQVCQQIAMRTDRCVDSAGEAFGLDQALVQALAHAVQALELEVLRFAAQFAGRFEYRCDAERVVGGEGRIDRRRGEKRTRARHVGHIRRRLAGEDRVVRQAGQLRPADFPVPVRPLDQPHGQHGVELRREMDQPGDDRSRAFLVGLHRHTEAAPAAQVPCNG